MVRLLPPFAFAVALVLSAGAAAQDGAKEKKAAGPAGVWTREAGGLDLKFDFTKPGTLVIGVFKGTDGAVVTSEYTVKGGVVKAKVTKSEEKGSFPGAPPVGMTFGFKWTAKGDTAELSDLTGEEVDQVRPIVEGEYKKAKGK